MTQDTTSQDTPTTKREAETANWAKPAMVVRLISGGPYMAVDDTDGNVVFLIWHNRRGELQRGAVPYRLITCIREPAHNG